MNPYSPMWGPHEKSLVWKPISEAPERILAGQTFLARWEKPLGGWQIAVAQYGQYGHCYISLPLGYEASAEDPYGEFIQEPLIRPEEWCDIPG